jgi:hypothetical protein
VGVFAAGSIVLRHTRGPPAQQLPSGACAASCAASACTGSPLRRFRLPPFSELSSFQQRISRLFAPVGTVP